MNKNFNLYLLLGFISLFATTTAHAQIVINGVVRTITSQQRPIENVNVTNTSSDKALQVNISAVEVTIDANRKEINKKTDEILIAPQAMILRPKETKKARLVLKNLETEKERYFRIKFSPKIPDAIRLKALEITKSEESKSNVNAAITILSGVGMFITVSPKTPKPKLTWERNETGITFKNEGNTSVDMRQRRNYCFADEDCTTLPDKRIYPGHSWHYEIAKHKPLVYYYNVYNTTQKAVIGAIE